MMQKTTLAGLVLAVLTLNACTGGTPQGGNNNVAASAAAAASAPQAASTPIKQEVVTLKSRDGKIAIDTFGQFADKMGDAELMPADVPADKIQMLQQDNTTGAVLTVVHAGKTQAAPEYFAKVKSALEADKSLSNLQIGDISANTMAYHFSQADADGNVLLNERCLIMLQDDDLYNICASHPEMGQDELEAALKYVHPAKSN